MEKGKYNFNLLYEVESMSVLKITSDNFEEEVIKSDKPVLVDFWASWCMPCKMMSQTVEDIANEMQKEVKVCKVNIDEEQELAVKYGVMSIPTFLVFKNGKVADMTVGVQEKENITKLLK